MIFFEEVEVGDRTLKIPAILPKLSKTPGKTDYAGPEVGGATRSTLINLGYSEEELDTMIRAIAIALMKDKPHHTQDANKIRCDLYLQARRARTAQQQDAVEIGS